MSSESEDMGGELEQKSNDVIDQRSTYAKKTITKYPRSYEDDDENNQENDDEDNQEDVEEEEEEEENRPRKKKKRTGNLFIDEEAAVDDDDDEDEFDEDEDLAPEEDFDETARAAYLDDTRHRDFDRKELERLDEDAAELAARFKERYRGDNYNAYQGQLEHVPQRLLIPSVNDSKLWLVKCKPGKEKNIVFTLLHKCFESQNSDNPLRIFSAFTRDSIKGFLYIEADKQASVQLAINQINDLYISKLQLVPVAEMVDCLTIKKKDIELNLGTYVRVKRGKHEGDLAQIIDLYDDRDIVRIKIVPRLDLHNTSKSSKNNRAPPQFFDIKNLPKNSGVQRIKNGKYQYANNIFDAKGFMEKDVKVSSLQTENVNPALDEIHMFSKDLDSIESQELLALAQANSSTPDDFQIGENIQVIQGDMINLLGVVKAIQNEVVSILPNASSGITKMIQLPSSHLRKRFTEGEHVKVVNGIHRDEIGLVLNVEDHFVTLLTDIDLKTIQVFAKDLRSASDVSNTYATIVTHQFEIKDLLQISPTECGVVIKADKELVILDQNGVLRKLKPEQIHSKRDSTRAVTSDSQGQTISFGDLVEVVENRKGESTKRGTVLHIFRSFVFIQSQELTENSGIFVTKSGSVNALTTKYQMSSQKFKVPENRYSRHKYHDPWVSKSVIIVTGPYKGYLGVLKEVLDQTARIELHTNAKVVSVNRNDIQLPDATNKGRDRESYGRNVEGGKSPYYGMGTKTPMGRDGSRTPGWGMDTSGGRTPAWGSEPIGGRTTPGWGVETSGGRTPAAATNGGQTPAWTSRESGSRTPAGRTPGGRAPSWSQPNISSGRTPSSIGGRTPTWTPREESRPSSVLSESPSIWNNTPLTSSQFGASPIFTSDSSVPDLTVENWVTHQIAVSIKEKGNLVAVVKSITADGRWNLETLDTNEKFTVTESQIEPIRPEKKDKVKILGGEFAGQNGLLIGIDSLDGIVKLSGGSDFKIVNMKYLAKHIE